VVIIPLIHAWNWTADFQRQTGLFFRNQGYPVICVETNVEAVNFRKWLFGNRKLVTTGEGGVTFVRLFHILPFDRFHCIYQINKKLSLLIVMAWLVNNYGLRRQFVLWIYHPELEWITVVKKWFSKSMMHVYDCMDNFTLDKGKERQDYRDAEKRIVCQADIVIAVSRKLQLKLKQYRKDVHYIPQGFRIDDFEKTVFNRPFSFGDKPVIGYVGGINDRLDFNLVSQLVGDNPQWTFVFWGPIHDHLLSLKNKILLDNLLQLKNVVHGYSDDRLEIPSVITRFTVGMMPYDRNNAFNAYCSPQKLFEYFYMGKPVVSTYVPELTTQNYVFMADSVSGWQTNLNQLIHHKWPSKYVGEQREIARKHSFAARYDRISNYLH